MAKSERPRNATKRKRCQVMIKGTNGKSFLCGMPLDVTGQCPEHGRPW